jgi:7-carboxy-7-deazaguanine synthase
MKVSPLVIPHSLRPRSGQASLLGKKLRVTEIFYSLQGETSRTGLPTVFTRLTGCPLRCHYCDTGYAFHNGRMMSIESILNKVETYATRYVTVTGGEPLAQENCLALLDHLCERDYSVSLETSGALDVSRVNKKVSKIIDIKTPGSGEESKNRWSNLGSLDRGDEIKFVLCSEADYDWAKTVLREKRLDRICPVLFSPSYHELPARDLAEWILRDQLPVRMQIQLHKTLWGETPGR